MPAKRRTSPRRTSRHGEEAPPTTAAPPATDVATPGPPAADVPSTDTARSTADPAAALAAELAGLSPAERYERLIEFPTDHPFKVIGAADQTFTDALRAALEGLGYPDADLQPRYSSGTRYVAFTVTLRVPTGAAMVRIYETLNHLPGLKYLL